MQREDVISQTKELTKKFSCSNSSSIAASFRMDSNFIHYVDFKFGYKKLISILEKPYFPFQWISRSFKEQEICEIYFIFTSKGELYGFEQVLSEDYFFNKKNMNKKEGISFLEDLLKQSPWNISLNETHELIEHSEEEQNNGRIDHEFVYSMRNVSIDHDSSYRIKMVLKGVNFTNLINYVEIPESFSLKYAELHSDNEMISSIAYYFIIGLYYISMMLGSVLFILNRKSFTFFNSFWYASLFSFLIFLQSLNTWPLIWMRYKTELDVSIFILQELISHILSFFQNVGYYFLLFVVAESLFRKSFENHFQLWKFTETIRSHLYIEEFFVSIFCLILFFSHSILLYMIGTNYFHWWTPSSMNEDKNALSHYLPAYSSIVSSLEAAISEEFLFRAIPISFFNIFAKKYQNHKHKIIFLGLIVQTLIFSAAHANYPSKPAYARLVELIIPSMIFGLLFLKYGLIAPIYVHFLYDLFWFSIPIMVSEYQIQKIFIFIAAASPLLFHLFMNILKEKVVIIDELKNFSMEMNSESSQGFPKQSSKTVNFSILHFAWIAVGISLFYLFNTTNQKLIPNFVIDSEKIVKIAIERYQQKQLNFSNYFISMSVENEVGNGDNYIIEKYGLKNYSKLYSIPNLSHPSVAVKFSNFESEDVVERAQNFIVYINRDGSIQRETHYIPEEISMKSMSKEEAQQIIQQNIDISNMNQISVSSTKLPNRIDWEFTFGTNISFLQNNSVRKYVQISGDKIVDFIDYIHISETWKRSQRKKKQFFKIFSGLCSQIYSTYFYGMIIVPLYFFNFKKFKVPFFIIFTTHTVFSCINQLNSYFEIIFNFSETEPFKHQLIQIIATQLLNIILSSGLFGLYFSFLSTNYKTQKSTLKHLFLGLSFGILTNGVDTMLEYVFPNIPFESSRYSDIISIYPMAKNVFTNLHSLSKDTIKLMLLCCSVNWMTDCWRSKKLLGIMFILFSSVVYFNDQNYISWAFQSIIYAFIALLGYSQLFSKSMESMVFFVVGRYLMNIFGRFFHQELYLNSNLISLVTAFSLFLFGLFFYYIFSNLKEKEE
eukprot:gene1765-534_t